MHVFEKTSRCNHSCIPNVDFEIENGKITLKAIEDIPEGEHLMINYLGDVTYFFTNREYYESSIFDSTAERQRALQSRFLFECQCPYCILESQKDASKIHKLFYLICNSPKASSEDLEFLFEEMKQFIESNYPYSYGFRLLEQMELIVNNFKEKEMLQNEIEYMSNEVKEGMEPKPCPEHHRYDPISEKSQALLNIHEKSSTPEETIEICVNESSPSIKWWEKAIICIASLMIVSIFISAGAYCLRYEF